MTNLSDGLAIHQLENGLILRRSNPKDAVKLAEFNSQIHGENTLPDDRVGWWTRDLLEKPHPTFQDADFTIIEEQETGRIVSSLCLISQTWTYDGIPFKVGRPEIVGTLPEYRNRGLVRKQFDEVHRWSAERGELVQAITGIPFYYRIFGYEMCVDLDGWRSGYEPNIPRLAPDETEPYRLRPVVSDDIPFIMRIGQHCSLRSLVYAVRDEALWNLELNGKSERNLTRLIWQIIEQASDGQPVGFLAHPWFAWKNSCPAVAYELISNISWGKVTPSVVRWLWNMSQDVCERENKNRLTFTFALGANHPVYEIMRDNMPLIREPYSWYLRLSYENLPEFIRTIAPVLEKRLSTSLIPGFSGEIKISFYTNGLKLKFSEGLLSLSETWQPTPTDAGDIAFPVYTFLQLIFGHRTLDELKKSFTDCRWNDEMTRVLVSTLFPRKPSEILAIA